MCFGTDNSEEIVRELEAEARRDRREELPISRLVAPPANPFAVFGPRVGVESISDVLGGERGARVSVSDIKSGIDRSVFSRPASGTPTKPTPNDTDDSKIRRPGSFGGSLI